MTPNTDLKNTPLFDVDYSRNGARLRHSLYNGIQIHARCKFE